MPEVPGVIVAPSDLAACAKTLSLPSWAPQGQATPSSVLINPGRLAKGPGGGTFAHLHVRQHQARPGGLAENIRVDILRI